MRGRSGTAGSLRVHAIAGTHVVLLGLDLPKARTKGLLGFAIERWDPTEQERNAVLGHLARAGDRRKAWEDACWAILNSTEFLLRH